MSWEEGLKKDIWENIGQKFSKFDRKYKPTNSRSSANAKNYITEENDIKAYHSQFSEISNKEKT